jgi:capping protein beta
VYVVNLIRSPWSNEYFPEIDSDFFPSENLRRMETICNKMLQEYSTLYYEGGVANAYFWDKEDDDNFSCCICVKKGIIYLVHLLIL